MMTAREERHIHRVIGRGPARDFPRAVSRTPVDHAGDLLHLRIEGNTYHRVSASMPAERHEKEMTLGRAAAGWKAVASNPVLTTLLQSFVITKPAIRPPDSHDNDPF
jgi:hypothetical protein